VSSYLTLRAEETPRYEDAPTSAPYRLSSIRHYFPIISGRVAAEPQMRNRNDELRGNLSPTAQIVESYAPAGSITVGAYMSAAIPLLNLSGLVLTPTQGNGANEVQQISASGTVTGGTYNLTIPGITSTPGLAITGIAYNATAAKVRQLVDERIRRGGTGFQIGDIVIGGGPLPTTPMTITYQGTLAATNVDPAVVNDTGLTGTSPAYTLSTTTAGSPGTVLLPDGRGLPPSAYRWTSAKRTGATAKSAEILAAYEEHGAYELGQGFGVSQLSLDTGGNFAATMLGLVARGADDPGLTPSYDSPAVHPLLSRDLIVTWRDGAGNISEFSWQISNPITASRHYGIRSAYPGKLRYDEGFVEMSGSVGMDEFDPDDRDSLLEAGVFAAEAHWRTRSKIGSTGALYEMFVQLPSCQLVGGQGAQELGARRRHSAEYEWMAAYDVTAGYDFRITLTSGLSAWESFA
jgi:hypothetical protein